MYSNEEWEWERNLQRRNEQVQISKAWPQALKYTRFGEKNTANNYLFR